MIGSGIFLIYFRAFLLYSAVYKAEDSIIQ